MQSGLVLNLLALLDLHLNTTLILCQQQGNVQAEPAVILSTGWRFGILHSSKQLKLSRLDVNCAQLTSALVKYRAGGIGNVAEEQFGRDKLLALGKTIYLCVYAS